MSSSLLWGDVVVVRSPEDPKCLLCKRIAALSGERVRTETEEEVKIPKGHVWLLGDNPNWSKDSRHFGAVPYGLIRGRAWFKVWPLTEFGKIQNPFDVKWGILELRSWTVWYVRGWKTAQPRGPPLPYFLLWTAPTEEGDEFRLIRVIFWH